MDWGKYKAVLFDLDGVLTPTAAVHRRAWSDTRLATSWKLFFTR